MATVTDTVAATGDQRIDGLLMGYAWTSTSITYGFPTQRSDYEAGYGDTAVEFGLAPVSTGQMQAVRQIAEGTKPFPGGPSFLHGSVESFTNLNLAEAPGAAADIRIALSSKASLAYAYYPAPIYPFMTATPEAGDQFFMPGFGNTPAAPGTRVWYNHIHELGHSLGLKHGQEDGGIAGALPAAVDSLEFTAMTYRTHVGGPPDTGFPEPGGDPQSFMMLDIAALQHLYGADYGANAGDTTYAWDPATGEMSVNGTGQGTPSANRVFLTIWDGGGRDTYDMSNHAGGVSIDLAPGGWSTTSQEQRSLLNYSDVVFNDAAPIHARGTVFNALLHQGNAASLIEDAVGGTGADAISANAAANLLRGRAGNDTMGGLDGNDTLVGGAGDDWLWGGDGYDIALVRGVRAEYDFGITAEGHWMIADKVAGRDGTDTMPGVDHVVFANPGLARYWDMAGSRHFYTADPGEMAFIAATIPSFRHEGTIGFAYDKEAGAVAPVHRFHAASMNDHHYTTNEAEAAWIQATLPHYAYEGVVFHVSESDRGEASKQVARFVNNQTHKHFFTSDMAEAASLEGHPDWTLEGTAFHLSTVNGVDDRLFA
jgi:hypothetical protein